MRNVLFVRRPVVQVALIILLLIVVAVVFTELQDHAFATSDTVTVTYTTLRAFDAVAETYNTLRVYGGSGWPKLRGNVGAGSGVVTDEVTGCLVETQPYTDARAIFNPQLPQAPRKDSITWNPLFMSEQDTPDENDAKHLYNKLTASGVNLSEKVWFRMWYEPEHWDKDDHTNCEFDRDPITGEPIDPTEPEGDEWYPAIMQEFTYLLMKLDPKKPTYGQAGATKFVFPVGMRYKDLFTDTGGVDTSSDNALYGYGLTSLDGNFDGKPDIVYVESERTLFDNYGITVDFDLDGIEHEYLDPDGLELSGDELAVFHLDILEFSEGGCVQFLDYMACLDTVLHGAAKLNVWYIGNRVPVGPTPVTVSTDSAFLVDHAWFAYLNTVNVDEDKAWLMVGRALGATHSAVESDLWHLKRFYVDGHEYNVVAIKTRGHTEFKFITIRTPIPKTEGPYYIDQHSVFLQNYPPEEPLSVMPPYNYQHYIFEDVQAITAFDESEYEVDYLGELVGPVPPILQENGPFPYEGAYPDYEVGPYNDPRELYLRYVDEGPNPQFLGELKEKYGEITATETITEFWYVEQWWTRPWEYTEFVLPDIHEDRTGVDNPDLYLLTSAFTAPQAEYLYWIQDDSTPLRYNLSSSLEHDEGEDTITPVLPGWKHRVKFWFDPAVGGKKYKALGRLRLYGRGNEGAGDTEVMTDTVVTEIATRTAVVEIPPYTDPWAPFNPQLPQAPRKDSLTFNPALMAMGLNGGELPLVNLYNQLKIEGKDAQEKVFFRMWHEPEYLDKVLEAEIVDDTITATDVFTFPALLQEFTYMCLDYDGQPSHAQPGNPPDARTRFAFPMGTASDQLPAPDPDTGQLDPLIPPAGPPSFGYGLTTFDADFDGSPDPVTIHSERTLFETTGIQADFDGNGNIDRLDEDGLELSGDELVIFAVESIDLERYESAMFLDYMVTLKNVTWDPTQPTRAVLQVWYTGGGIYETTGGHSIHPKSVADSYILKEGEMAVFLKGFSPKRMSAGENNLGDTDGAWFVYVQGLNYSGKTAVLTIGRALGATHSAIDDGDEHPDLTPGDPWYLKRFFVDGHEYNVVAIKTVPADIPLDPEKDEDFEFKYITIRTPVPKVIFRNTEDSLVLQGYHLGTIFDVDTNIISVMPPFNHSHTRVKDIQKLEETAVPEGETEEETVFANDKFYYDKCKGDWEGDVDPLEIEIKRQCIEMQFFGELKEKYWEEGEGAEEEELWSTEQFHTQPHLCTELELPAGQLYLLTSDWESDQSWVHYYGCDPTDDHFTHDELHALHPSIPAPNAVITFTGGITSTYYTGPLRVKFWYDPEDPDGLYVGTWGTTPTCEATASSNSPVCEGETIELYGEPDDMDSYSWTGPGGFSSTDQNPTRPNGTLAMAGTYTLTVTTDDCTATATTNVTVNEKPTATASSNSPVDEGDTIELYGEPDGMTSYNWVGPGGWTSNVQNPTRPEATMDMGGTYTLIITDTHGCSDSDTTYVAVATDENQGLLVPQHSSASHCNTTDVDILVNATGFKSGQIKLTYVDTCAEVTGWHANLDDFYAVEWETSTPGQEWITFYAQEPMTGTYRIGTLTIHCESEDPCTTDLDFVEDGPWTTKLFDEGGHEIPGTWEDGTFTCGVAACGDVNCDDEVNMGDVGVLHTYVSHRGDYPICCEWCGDVAPCPNEPPIEIDMGDVSRLHTYVSLLGDYELCCDEGLLTTAAPAPAVPAAADNEVYLVPQDSSAPFCETADVEIWANASGFKSGQIKLAYNSACADVEDWEPNLDDFSRVTWKSDTSGEEWITFLAQDALTGTYRIGTLTIHAVYEEGCATILDFVEDGEWTSKLFDEGGYEISATWTDGTFASPRYKVYLPLMMKNFQ